RAALAGRLGPRGGGTPRRRVGQTARRRHRAARGVRPRPDPQPGQGCPLTAASPRGAEPGRSASVRTGPKGPAGPAAAGPVTAAGSAAVARLRPGSGAAGRVRRGRRSRCFGSAARRGAHDGPLFFLLVPTGDRVRAVKSGVAQRGGPRGRGQAVASSIATRNAWVSARPRLASAVAKTGAKATHHRNSRWL